MRPNPRAAVAYIAGAIISCKRISSVYDYSRSQYISIDGTIRESSVDVYDYDQGCHISGNGSGDQFSLYHYGDSHHIDLTVRGNHFEGFDYGSSCHFSGDVSGNSISLYDYGEGGYFNYSI